VRISGVRDGAAEIAPTAPHATPPPLELAGKKRRTRRPGPARFWARGPVRVALVVGFVISLFVHYELFPWHLLPQGSVSLQDVAGELTTPVDLMGEETHPPKATPPPAPTQEPPKTDENAIGADAAAPRRDAGPRDSGTKRDAGADGSIDDGGPIALLDDAGEGDADTDAMVAQSDAGGWGGGTDPGILAGAPESGPPNIVLIVNARVVRSHPVGARVGPLLSAIPQWDDFMAGSNIDPVKDGEWLLIYGPSLINTSRDAIVIHYNAPDPVVDHAIDLIRTRSHNGAPFDAGVAGVKATLGHADRAPRVFLRFPSHIVAVVPPEAASKQALHWSKNAKVLMGKIPPGAAVWIKVMQPSNHLKDRDGDPVIPPSVSQLTLWVSPNPDGTADVRAEGLCADAAAAGEAALKLREFMRRQNAGLVRAIMRGLLTPLEQESAPTGEGLRAEGTKVRLYVRATQEQLEAVLNAVAFKLGVSLAPAPSTAPTTTAPPPATTTTASATSTPATGTTTATTTASDVPMPTTTSTVTPGRDPGQ
jgi:hypothetical protein